MEIFANYGYKAELLQLNHTQFIFLRNFIKKKSEFKKTKTTQYSTFKTDTITVGLGFSISNFFINKMYQANKLSAKKVPS